MATFSIDQLTNAAHVGNLEIFKKWKQANPHVSIDAEKTSRHETPLHYACVSGKLNIAKYLVESCDATVDAKGTPGRTALDYACSANHLEVVKYLVESCQADITIVNNKQQTALQVAENSNNAAIVKYLSNPLKPVASEFVHSAKVTHALFRTNHNNINQQRLDAFQNNRMADITFLVGRDDQQQQIKAYSGILLVTIPSIQAIIDQSIGDQVETEASADSTSDGIIPLPDFHPEHVRYILQYIYSADTSFLDDDDMANMGNLQQLLIVAAHFGCWQLKVAIEAKLVAEHLMQPTLIDLLLFANEHECEVLKDSAVRLAAKDASALLSDPQFHKLGGCVDLMKAIHLAHKDSKDNSSDDEYEKKSMVELYGCLNDCKDVRLESYMDRPSLLELVRKSISAKTE